MTKLSELAVETILFNVLYQDEEISEVPSPPDAVKVKGLVQTFGFHPARLAESKAQIDELLRELPENFHMDKGGGWSFLNACLDKDGELWGQHRHIEALVCLGIGVGSASWMMLEFLDILPGGMPYFEIHPGMSMN